MDKRPESPNRRFHVTVVRRSQAKALSDKKIREAVQHVLRRHKASGCDLEVVILGTASMRRMNERWLGHQGPTDVITFDLADGPVEEMGQVAGQISVCWPLAQRQAASRGVRPADELLLYVVHGTLHLLGYDDHDPAAAARMHRREDQMLGQLGYGPVYAAPAAPAHRR